MPRLCAPCATRRGEARGPTPGCARILEAYRLSVIPPTPRAPTGQTRTLTLTAPWP